MADIGLFPLGIVLLPGEQRPLHIFEPRYKELIGECLEEDREFGLLLADDAGMREVGTSAAVVELVDRFPDGRMNVVVEGRERFRVVELTEGRSFATADVAPLPDDDEQPTDEELERLLAAYRRVVEAAGADFDEPDRERASLAFQIGARIDLGPETKQELLELRSERERTVRLTPLLDHAAAAVLREREIRERAASNGRVEAL